MIGTGDGECCMLQAQSKHQQQRRAAMVEKHKVQGAVHRVHVQTEGLTPKEEQWCRTFVDMECMLGDWELNMIESIKIQEITSNETVYYKATVDGVSCMLESHTSAFMWCAGMAIRQVQF